MRQITDRFGPLPAWRAWRDRSPKALIRRDQDYQDRRETLAAVLVAGEVSGPCERTLVDTRNTVKFAVARIRESSTQAA